MSELRLGSTVTRLMPAGSLLGNTGGRMSDLPLASRSHNLIGSVIDSSTELLAKQSHDIVRFAMGAPSEDLIPVAELDEAFASAAFGRFDYGDSAGEPALRDEIVRLSHSAGVATSNDRIVVTNGAMQGLDIAFKLLVDPGDLVIVENPTYPNGYATATSYEAHVVSAPMDDHGLVVEALPDIVKQQGKTPKAIYTIPTFQNPTGVTLSRERREMLLELAEKWGSVIIEDDPYSLLRFEGDSIPSLLELSPHNPLVFRIQTFSKLLAPGLRIGWIDVDPQFQRLAVNAKQAIDTCTNVPNQLAVARLLQNGVLESHLDRLLPLYAERKTAMTRSLSDTFGDSVTFTEPEGGFFVWASLVNDLAEVNTHDLFPLALAEGVAYVPGSAFSLESNFSNSLRLCFATSAPDRIDEGVRRLRHAISISGMV
jgi:2-aminoadipate transaminase